MAEETRSRGVVRWFSDSKGYGFIKPDEGEEELFVHHSSIKSDGYRTLTEGDTVEFTFAVREDNKPKAVDVTGPNGDPIQPPPSGRRRLNGGGGGGWRRDNPSDGAGCYNCGAYGHLARDCSNNGPSGGGSGSGGGSCYTCGQPGHFARECRSMSGGGGGGGFGGGACYSCGGFGHMARDCRQGGGSYGGRSGGGGGSGCFNCGGPGHFARECTNRA